MSALRAALAGLFEERRETRLLGLMRVAFGFLLLGHARRLFEEMRALGHFKDRFHLPLLPESWVPDAAAYGAMLVAMAALAALVVLGVRAREGLLLTSSMGLYLLACDRLQYHNNRFALLLLAFLLAFAPCDRSYALLAPRRRFAAALGPGGPPGPAPVWAQRMFQLQVSLVYASSAISKVFDPDWFGGQVMWVRAARSLEHFAERGITLPDVAALAMQSKLVLNLFSKLAIGGELFLAIGLWLPRTRVLALWWGTLFHLQIELGANVELFSYVMWSSFLAFVTPELRERQLLVAEDARPARALGIAVRALDWLSRWSVRPVPRSECDGALLCAIDRDGRRATGLRAAALITRTLPALFLAWVPFALLARAGGRQARTSR